MWTYTHDADRRLTATTDPLGHQTLYGYNGDGERTSLTDPNGNLTRWTYDVEGRLTGKQYADTSTVTDTYETTTSRLAAVLDALGQTKQYGYAADNRLTSITYLDALNPTPNVGFAYDPYFPRLTSMTDGNGATQYSYVPVGSLGALKLQQEESPLADSAIVYAYDELGRPTSRGVAGAGAESFAYDALGRLTGHGSDLGTFALSYLGQTGQITQRQLAGASLATDWSYLPNSGDRRLAGIDNTGLSTSQYSNYTYTTTPEDQITAIAETSDSSAVYPTAGTQTAGYNNLNQLTDLSGQMLSYDADGNLLSDGQRDYAWDAENRLVGITYPAQPGKATTFTYDGLSRRTAIASTPAGGGATVTTSYLWCGSTLCQARDASGAVTREYYAEGELVPGSPAQPYYYGPDQIGSVRRVFTSTSNAPAYSYDPYGNALQGTAPLTDFNYAGIFYNADSGLYLTQYRADDPVAGRWLSRDPLGESSDPAENLYVYVSDDPLNKTDPLGEDPVIGALVGLASGAFYGGLGAASSPCADWTSIAVGAVAGGGLGLITGLVDPSVGIGTLAVIGGVAGAAGDIAGQAATNYLTGNPLLNLNYGSAIGAAVGGAVGGGLGGAVTNGLSAVGISELGATVYGTGVGGWVSTAITVANEQK